jgi:hypothetical protein
MIDMAAQRERIWGLAGGAIGAAFGISSALIAMVVDGAPASSSMAARTSESILDEEAQPINVRTAGIPDHA